MAFDEGSGLHRLRKNKYGYGEHIRFPLKDYIELPAGDGGEVDIEGLSYAGHYLWVVGSHSLKRKKPNNIEDSIGKQIKCLCQTKSDHNRYTLARIPVIYNDESGDYDLFKMHPHPENPELILSAAKLDSNNYFSQLSDELRYDRHLAKFMDIPGKDNGFDIEGLAVKGNRVFLGLRGPVLRGYAIILEIALKEKKVGKLKLKKIGKDSAKYRKHFVHLQGMGIRELTFADEDLIILAGPTMDCDGAISLYRVRSGIKDKEESIANINGTEQLFHISLGHETPYGHDKAEGVALTEDHKLLVVYDSPCDERVVGETDAYADVFEYE